MEINDKWADRAGVFERVEKDKGALHRESLIVLC